MVVLAFIMEKTEHFKLSYVVVMESTILECSKVDLYFEELKYLVCYFTTICFIEEVIKFPFSYIITTSFEIRVITSIDVVASSIVTFLNTFPIDI